MIKLMIFQCYLDILFSKLEEKNRENWSKLEILFETLEKTTDILLVFVETVN